MTEIVTLEAQARIENHWVFVTPLDIPNFICY